MYKDKNKKELIRIIEDKNKEILFLMKKITYLESEIDILKNDISQRINRDNLTGLYNREVTREAYNNSKTVIMCDIDDFKILNDNYGHNFGDIVLKEVARLLKKNVRDTDYVIRWGGEEFLIFIDNEDINVAKKLAERIRKEIEKLIIKPNSHSITPPQITMSFGVSNLHTHSSLFDDIEKVDNALYKSKRKGKNIVTAIDKQDGEKQRKNS